MKHLRHIFSVGILIALVSSAGAQSWLTNGLVAYYPFNGNANDASGFGNDGNATALAFSGDRFGKSSKAGEFNGTSAYVEIPSLTTFQYLPLTYSVWIKTSDYLPPVSYINQVRIIMGREQACDASCGALSLYSEPRYGINDILGYYTGAEFLSSQTRPNLSSWMQLVLTIDINNRGAFYLNGNLVSSQQLGQLSTSFYPIRIGHGTPSVCSPSPDDFWKGGLDDVRIYNRALSSNEVAQLYNIESTPPAGFETNGLVAYYPFNGNANDESGNGNDGIISRATPAGDRFGAVNAAYAFSGRNIPLGQRSWIDITNSLLNIQQPAFSISMWVSISNLFQETGVFLNTIPLHNGIGAGYNSVPNRGKSSWAIGDGYNWLSIYQTGNKAGYNTNDWYHFTFIKSGNNYYQYVNGVLDFVQYADVSNSLNLGLRLGGDSMGDENWEGNIDDVRIYNRALSSNEVAQLYALEAPVPPVITLQPQSFAAIAGSFTNLSVTATGSQLLTYQWLKDGVALPGATNASLLFSNLQPVNVGDYVAVVSNGGGSVTSGVASVSIPGVNSGVWQGLVAYYPFNGNANDESGLGNDGDVFEASQTNDRFGKSASAYSFNGFNSYINTKDADVFRRLSTNYTVAFWINSGDLNQGAYIVTKDIWAVSQWAVVSGYTSGSVNLFVQGAWSPNALISDNQWFAICITYDGSRLSTYVNSSCVGNVVTNAELPSVVGAPLRFGSARYYDGSPVSQFNGSLDEIRIYNRALSSNEVAQLYALESPVPPTFTLQPQSLVAASGSVTNLSVGATGSDVIRYQWLKDGVALPGATNATLLFSNLQPVNVGDYVAVVSNGGGSVTSSVASVSIPGVNSGLWQGLVAYYPFNGNANDESGFGRDGVQTGVVSISDRYGAAGKAMFFDGIAGHHIEIPDSTALLEQRQPFSISSWVRLDRMPTGINSSILSFWGVFAMLATDITGANTIFTEIFGDAFLRSAFHLDPSPNHFHLLVTFNGTTQSTYLNGAQLQTTDDSQSVTFPPRNLVIGGDLYDEDKQTFNGVIDDVRIYNRALSSNDVAALYQLETAAPVFVTQPATVTHQIGEAVILSVQSAGGQPTTYTWHFSGAALNSSTNSSLTIASLQAVHLGAYTVVASNQWGMATSSVATVYCPASIIAPPISVVSPLGGQALFLVEAAGYDLPTYQWMLNGTNLPNATASSLAVTNVQLRNAGSYAVVVSNSLGRVTSSVAWLSVSPSLYTPFVGATPIWGRSASIGVSAVGSGQLNFQWYLNGVAIDGATAPSINFPSIQFTNAGMYSVVISSAYGIVTNAAAEVSVNPAEVDLAFYPGLTINGHTGNRYTIQSSSDLSNTNNWITQTNLMLEMDTQLWFDSSVKASDPNNTQYFYRVLPEN